MPFQSEHASCRSVTCIGYYVHNRKAYRQSFNEIRPRGVSYHSALHIARSEMSRRLLEAYIIPEQTFLNRKLMLGLMMSC